MIQNHSTFCLGLAVLEFECWLACYNRFLRQWLFLYTVLTADFCCKVDGAVQTEPVNVIQVIEGRRRLIV